MTQQPQLNPQLDADLKAVLPPMGSPVTLGEKVTKVFTSGGKTYVAVCYPDMVVEKLADSEGLVRLIAESQATLDVATSLLKQLNSGETDNGK